MNMILYTIELGIEVEMAIDTFTEVLVPLEMGRIIVEVL